MFFHLDSVFQVFCLLLTHYADDAAGFWQWTVTSTINHFIIIIIIIIIIENNFYS
jgi:hypothetical protein